MNNIKAIYLPGLVHGGELLSPTPIAKPIY